MRAGVLERLPVGSLVIRRALLAWAALSLSGCAAAPPATYADCVLAHVRAGMAKEAVQIACEACRQKFPLPASAADPTDHDRQLLTAALAEQWLREHPGAAKEDLQSWSSKTLLPAFTDAGILGAVAGH